MAEPLAIQNFIDGQFVAHSGSFLDSYDPSRDEVWAQVPDSGPPEVEAAVSAARRAFPR